MELEWVSGVGVCGRGSGSGRVEKRTSGAERGWVLRDTGDWDWEGPGWDERICRERWDDVLHSLYVTRLRCFI